jgi:RNA recognition motif-containing protein
MGMGMPLPGAPPQKRQEKFSLYVGNLSDNVYDTELFQFFKHQGFLIAGAKVVFNKETK